MRAIRVLAVILFIATVAIGLVSCAGSGASQTGRGRLRLTVRWPRTRDIPPATRSLRVTVKTLVEDSSGSVNEDVEVANQVVQRPEGEATSSLTLVDLPSVLVRVNVQAFASTDASGTPIAAGHDEVTIREDQTTSASVTLTAVAELEDLVASPTSVNVATGGTVAVSITAKTADGTVVPIDGSRLKITQGIESIATAKLQGATVSVRGVSPGTTSIMVEDTQSSAETTIPVVVTSTPISGCQEYKVTLGGQSLTDQSGVQLHDGTSAAIASGSDGGVTLTSDLSGSARSKDIYKIFIPEDTISATIHYKVAVIDNNPDVTGGSGSATVTWPGGSKTMSGFGVLETTVPVTLSVNQEVTLIGSASASNSNGDSVSASYSVWIEGNFFETAHCGF